MSRHTYVVVVEAPNADRALQVMQERIEYDEQLAHPDTGESFDYSVSFADDLERRLASMRIGLDITAQGQGECMEQLAEARAKAELHDRAWDAQARELEASNLANAYLNGRIESLDRELEAARAALHRIATTTFYAKKVPLEAKNLQDMARDALAQENAHASELAKAREINKCGCSHCVWLTEQAELATGRTPLA